MYYINKNNDHIIHKTNLYYFDKNKKIWKSFPNTSGTVEDLLNDIEYRIMNDDEVAMFLLSANLILEE